MSSTATVEAQVKPFKIVGSGIGPTGLPLPGEPPRMHWAIGQATHLGRYYGEGGLQNATATLPPVNGRISGNFGSSSPFVFKAANGDKLACYYGRTFDASGQPDGFNGSYELTIVDVLPSGQLLVNAKWIAEFVVQPDESTGHFAGATGSWTMYAQTDKPFLIPAADPVYYSWQGEGRLSFPKP